PEIFYSPSRNSCLVSYMYSNRRPGERVTVYNITDLLTNERIYGKAYSEEQYSTIKQIDDASNDFNNTIAELKKQNINE
ncbi:MAG: hypothetical protein AAB593_00225, partial [Patescibacteria group bacterium]